MDAATHLQETFSQNREALGGIQAEVATPAFGPGDYDLSIQNRKLPLRQRRLKDVVCVSISPFSVYGTQNQCPYFLPLMTTNPVSRKQMAFPRSQRRTACGTLVTLWIGPHHWRSPQVQASCWAQRCLTHAGRKRNTLFINSDFQKALERFSDNNRV